MGYYDDLRDAVHERLHWLNKIEGKSFRNIHKELNVSSPEELRRLAGDEYRDFEPSYHILETLQDALHVVVSDSPYRAHVPENIRGYINQVNSYLVKFGPLQCQIVLRECRDINLLCQEYGTQQVTLPLAAEETPQYKAGSSHRNPAASAGSSSKG